MNERVGCAIEPRNLYNRGQRRDGVSTDNRQDFFLTGKATVSCGRKPADPMPIRSGVGSPPGSENRAYAPMGNLGTWESQMFPCEKKPEKAYR